jgi:hypothetical protein
MARPDWRDPAKERFWRRMLRRFARSGLNIRDFCKGQHLREPSFYHWRPVLAQRDHEAAPPAQVAPLSFLPVQIRADVPTAPVPAAPAPAIEVVLVNGRCLRVPAGFDAELLRRLLVLLEEGAAC